MKCLLSSRQVDKAGQLFLVSLMPEYYQLYRNWQTKTTILEDAWEEDDRIIGLFFQDIRSLTGRYSHNRMLKWALRG